MSCRTEFAETSSSTWDLGLLTTTFTPHDSCFQEIDFYPSLRNMTFGTWRPSCTIGVRTWHHKVGSTCYPEPMASFYQMLAHGIQTIDPWLFYSRPWLVFGAGYRLALWYVRRVRHLRRQLLARSQYGTNITCSSRPSVSRWLFEVSSCSSSTICGQCTDQGDNFERTCLLHLQPQRICFYSRGWIHYNGYSLHHWLFQVDDDQHCRSR